MALELFKRSYMTLVVLRFLRERPMYGYELCQAFAKASQGRYELKYGALYPLLRVLEKAGIIKGEWEESPEGPPRKRYSLLPKAHEVFAEEHAALEALNRLAGLKVVEDSREV